MKFLGCCAALLLGAVASLSAQVSHRANKADGSWVISGVVVSATSGQALSNATISLNDSNGGPFQLETTSDAEGNFAFSSLYAGKFAIRASHRGYITAGFDEHEGFFTGIVTGDGMASTDLKVRIEPQALISGTVTDDFGDTVAQASMRLYSQDDRSGRQKIVLRGQTQTDDLGKYEFPGLAAGNYFLVVVATPWYATRPQPTLKGSSDPNSPLDVAFATTYYPNATDSDTATPIPVKAADRIPINMTLHAQPAVRITFTLPASPDAQVLPTLKEKIFGDAQFTHPASYLSPPEGGNGDKEATMQVAGLAPGEYSFELGRSSGAAGGQTTVDTSSGPAVVDMSSLATLASVDGKLAMDNGLDLPSDVAVELTPEEGHPLRARLDTKGSFHLDSIDAGNYRLGVTAGGNVYAMKQLAATGATVDGSLVKIGSAAVTLAGLIMESNASVRGFAKLDGKPASGAMIVLVPSSGAPEAFRRDQSDSDGSFKLQQVMPGRYTLVAIEDGWSLEWARAEVMQAYLARGLKVSVPPHSSNIDLKDAIALQMK